MIAFLQRWKSRLAPFKISLIEMFFVRMGIAIAVWTIFPLQTYPGEPHPNGLARLLPGDNNFTWFHDEGTKQVCTWIMIGALVLYVFHRFAWLAYPVIIALLVISGTLTNSQSEQVTHHSQILSLVVLGQGVWYFIGWWKERKSTPSLESRVQWHTLAFFFSMQIVMATYMVSVVSKMVNSDGKWIAKSANMPVQLEKNRLMDYYNDVDPHSAGIGGDSEDPQGAEGAKGAQTSWFDKLELPAKTQTLFIEHPNIARISLTAGVALEFFCFLALLGRRPALLYGLLLVAFHMVISWTMHLTFRYHISLLMIYFVGIPYWLTLWLPERLKNPKFLAS